MDDPTVRWRRDGEIYMPGTTKLAGRQTYGPADMCDKPATDEGWSPVGWIYTATMGGLLPAHK